MDPWLKYISAFSLSLPFIISIIRYKKLDERFNPFIWVIWVGMTTEIASTLLIKFGYTNNWLTNIYILIEALLLFELFRRWQLFDNHQWVYRTLLGLSLAGWVLELYVRGSIHLPFSIFYRIQ